jgi:4-hydroxy-3-polyprenylbenzoate decarboxylase
MTERHVVLALTGASGAIYGLRLGQELLANGMRLTVLISSAGFAVLKQETGLDWRGGREEVLSHLQDYFHASAPQLDYYADDDFLAPVASGSRAPDAMVVCPCSMGTLSRIAAGNSGTLLERVADVVLKERRSLVVVPRETPLSEIHLENMLKLARMGVRLVPAMPAFYHNPRSIDELVDFMVGKVLDSLGVANSLYRRWGEDMGAEAR